MPGSPPKSPVAAPGSPKQDPSPPASPASPKQDQPTTSTNGEKQQEPTNGGVAPLERQRSPRWDRSPLERKSRGSSQELSQERAQPPAEPTPLTGEAASKAVERIKQQLQQLGLRISEADAKKCLAELSNVVMTLDLLRMGIGKSLNQNLVNNPNLSNDTKNVAKELVAKWKKTLSQEQERRSLMSMSSMGSFDKVSSQGSIASSQENLRAPSSQGASSMMGRSSQDLRASALRGVGSSFGGSNGDATVPRMGATPGNLKRPAGDQQLLTKQPSLQSVQSSQDSFSLRSLGSINSGLPSPSSPSEDGEPGTKRQRFGDLFVDKRQATRDKLCKALSYETAEEEAMFEVQEPRDFRVCHNPGLQDCDEDSWLEIVH